MTPHSIEMGLKDVAPANLVDPSSDSSEQIIPDAEAAATT